MSTKKKKVELKLDKAALRKLAVRLLQLFSRFGGILFFLLIAIVYGFIIMRISALSNIQPSQSDIDAQTKSTPIPRIEPKIAGQLEQLEDNSVNVQTLFNQARNNPFE